MRFGKELISPALRRANVPSFRVIWGYDFVQKAMGISSWGSVMPRWVLSPHRSRCGCHGWGRVGAGSTYIVHDTDELCWTWKGVCHVSSYRPIGHSGQLDCMEEQFPVWCPCNCSVGIGYGLLDFTKGVGVSPFFGILVVQCIPLHCVTTAL